MSGTSWCGVVEEAGGGERGKPERFWEGEMADHMGPQRGHKGTGGF